MSFFGDSERKDGESYVHQGPLLTIKSLIYSGYWEYSFCTLKQVVFFSRSML